MDHFQGSFGRKPDLAKTEEAFLMVLSKYSDEQISQAGWKWLDDQKKWPTPSDIKEIIQSSSVSGTSEGEGSEMIATCSKCGKKKWCRKELPRHPDYECEDCFTGLNIFQRRARYRDLIVKMGWN